MTWARVLAYGAAGAFLAVTITVAVTGSIDPLAWPHQAIALTFVNSVALSLGVAGLMESLR